MARLFIINNTKFGFKGNNDNIRNEMKKYFEFFFIPYIKENYKKGDLLIHTGGLFSDTNLNIITQNVVIDIFDELSKTIPVIFLLSKKDLDPTCLENKNINTFNIFRHNKKIKIVDSDFKLNKQTMLQPWSKKAKLYNSDDISLLISNIDYRSNMKSLNNNITHLNGFLNDYEINENVINIGTPYQLSKNDRNKDKGFIVYSIDKKEYKFVKNTINKKYLKIRINNEEDLYKIDTELIKNNIVDIEIPVDLKESNGTKIELFLFENNFNKIIYYNRESKSNKEENNSNILKSLEDILNKEISKYGSMSLQEDYNIILEMCKNRKTDNL